MLGPMEPVGMLLNGSVIHGSMEGTNPVEIREGAQRAQNGRQCATGVRMQKDSSIKPEVVHMVVGTRHSLKSPSSPSKETARSYHGQHGRSGRLSVGVHTPLRRVRHMAAKAVPPNQCPLRSSTSPECRLKRPELCAVLCPYAIINKTSILYLVIFLRSP